MKAATANRLATPLRTVTPKGGRDSDPASLKDYARRLLWPVPRHLSRNHIRLDASGRAWLRASLEQHYYTDWRAGGRYTQDKYDRELAGQLRVIEQIRRNFIPWLDHACPLQGRRVVEVGCGTGSSTVALAEQGARVTAIDIHDGSLEVARDRCRLYGLGARLIKLSGDSIASLGENAADLVVFSASLEHMTIEERLAALKGAWHIVPAGGAVAVLDTPNRLWYFDQHTSQLPFYNWLPNDLAFHYSRFSPRENFRELYDDYTPDSELHFLRRGRGVSFHEFELAIRPARSLKVISSLSSYRGRLGRFLGQRASRKYKSMLMQLCPGIHEGFFDPSLELVIARD